MSSPRRMPESNLAASPRRRSEGDLAARLLSGERAALPEALNLVDDDRAEPRARALALLQAIGPAAAKSRALRIGLTGAPGAGKSSLLDALVRLLRQDGQTVGIIAVDPSSQRSGGALLGDRVRVRSGAGDEGVFLRSMAARSRLGGIADATYAGLEILSVAFDYVFVETVGVGQSESEVNHLVDTLVFVAQPAAGDMLQFMKAGIIELPDIFTVNKADLGAAAARSAGELSAGLGLGEANDAGWQPPVLLTSAVDGTGIEALLEAIRKHRQHLDHTGALGRCREQGRLAYICEALGRRYGSYGLERIGGREGVVARMRQEEDQSAPALAAALAREIEARLGG